MSQKNLTKILKNTMYVYEGKSKYFQLRIYDNLKAVLRFKVLDFSIT